MNVSSFFFGYFSHFLNGKDNWANLFPGILEKMDFSPLRLTGGEIKSPSKACVSWDFFHYALFWKNLYCGFFFH
ncbi:MAG: hypothetical protein WAN90_03615, partial [Dysgonamonadaceae bacterium]